MLSEFQQGMAEISAKPLLDLSRWQKIQNLFAEVIGANLWLINAQGIPLAQPSKVCAYCSDLDSANYPSSKLPGCFFKAFQISHQNGEGFYLCPHGVTYFLVSLTQKDQVSGYVVGGPIILGKKEADEHYRSICQATHNPADDFLDWIRELKVFSRSGISLVVSFLKELGPFVFSEKIEGPTTGEVARSLLDIASQMVGADSGSVLLFDPAKNVFVIQSARGLKAQILQRKKIPCKDGVAGWVMEHRTGVLIGRDGESSVPKSRLKRPSIKSSIVIPLQFHDRVYGVFCLNTNRENDRFNHANLLFLSQLGQIAGAAFSRSNLN